MIIIMAKCVKWLSFAFCVCACVCWLPLPGEGVLVQAGICSVFKAELRWRPNGKAAQQMLSDAGCTQAIGKEQKH